MSIPSYIGNEAHTFLVLTLEKVIVFSAGLIAGLLPKIDERKINKHNTKLMIKWRDEFLANEKGSTRQKAFEGIWNYGIFKNETSSYYSKRINKIAKWLKESDWVYVPDEEPSCNWKGYKGAKANKEARHAALLKALENKEWDKVMDIID